MGDSNVDNKVEAGAVQGGNFVQCSLNNPVFNIHTQGRTPFSQNYQRIRIIGRGTFGDVWLVKPKHVTSSEQFVVKEIPFCDQDVVSGKNEIEILKHCLHENIVQYIESFVEEGKILIVMEFCRGGDLMQLIKKQRPNNYFPESTVIDFFQQMTKGTAYIHNKKILHRDLKPSNIFISSEHHLKIGDFGISKKHNNTISMANTAVGTLIYTAPEVHGGIPYNEKVDVWALGCILYELATLEPPFRGQNFFLSLMQVVN